MQRAPIVLAGTVAGVVGVLGYHTAAPHATAVASSSATPTTTSTTTTSATKPKATTKTTTATKTASPKTKTATGEDVSFRYGDIAVKVTKTGTKITDVSVVSLQETDPHSQQIDEFAIPQLRAEALSAQSAKIDGVSGASYTSAAYDQSLQSALDKLA